MNWEHLTSFSDTFTCYSAAISTWVAERRDDWTGVVNPGLTLTLLTGEPGDRFGFAHFPPHLRSGLGLARVGADSGAAAEATAGVLEELGRSGRVIVAGDGFNLPWHVAFERLHVPHWYVLGDGPDAPTVLDPFACRNQLGNQLPFTETISGDRLAPLLVALPPDDPVTRLRERLAFGDDAGAPDDHGYQWFAAAGGDEDDGAPARAPAGVSGAEAVRRLATHFRDHGQEISAYAQADDIWSIARHRAFLCRYAETLGREDVDGWVQEHGAPLAKRWSHMAPLIMQATLALGAGRSASASVPDTLADLAEREDQAARTLPGALGPGTI